MSWRAAPPLSAALFALSVGAWAAGAANLEGCVQLQEDEILSLFADVEERALVRQRSGGSATNRWFANGTFDSRWRTAAVPLRGRHSFGKP